ncbi:MAG: hypothetical protein JXR03_15385 [Cyclobacteriaceae bacterium]
MNRLLLSIALIMGCFHSFTQLRGQANYRAYHAEVIKCEEFVAERKFKKAISNFDSLFSGYDFVFLREIKVATQLCVFVQDSESCARFLRLGISSGWSLKEIEKSSVIDFIGDDPEWRRIKSEYDSLHNQYLKRLNIQVKHQIQEMFKKDQKKAIGRIFRIGDKSRDQYSERKFAPHSEKQHNDIDKILNDYGYPGERLIGNNWQTSVILSHHNSISKTYNSEDTLYGHIKPKLTDALKRGELSPYTFAIIEDWRVATLNGHSQTSYGFLGAITSDSVLNIVNQNRIMMGLRGIELRNKLIDVEKETGMNLYINKDWKKGKITVLEK